MVDATIVALVGTVMGGVGLKVAEHMLGKGKIKVDDAARLRDELRMEITAQREEIRQLESDVEKWRKEYYDLFQKYMNLETDLKLALHNIKTEVQHAQESTETIAEQPPTTPPTP